MPGDVPLVVFDVDDTLYLERDYVASGFAALESAAPGHVEDVRRNFIDLLTPAELDMLATLNERVLNHLAKDDDSPTEDEPA